MYKRIFFIQLIVLKLNTTALIMYLAFFSLIFFLSLNPFQPVSSDKAEKVKAALTDCSFRQFDLFREANKR